MKICLGILLALVLVSGATAETLSLVTLESPPAEYSENGESRGRNVDIARECLKRMGFDCTVKIIPWKRALIMVKNGFADAIIDAAFTFKRSEFLYFPYEAIYVEEWYLFKRTGESITMDRGLANAGLYDLGISRGFQYGGMIQETIDNRRFKSIQEVVNNEMNIMKLVKGRFDVFVGVKMTVKHLSRQMGVEDKIRIVPMTETGKPYLLSSSKTYVAFSKKTMTRDIADLFSYTLRQMIEDGTVGKIESRYF
ncbi:MAG: transporter substrate-binding domain-containing protein [Desulfobacterales bacterium]|nr:transporter substrate-binding domain-containing protein [Desulfobacterales bacterium]